MIKEKQLHMLRKFKTFDLYKEEWSVTDDETTTMEVYRNKAGNLIDCRYKNKRPGLVKVIALLEISPEPIRKGGVCCIGKSARDGKWYGWSHRAIVGFGKGDRIFEEKYRAGKLCKACHNGEDCTGLPCPSSTSFAKHGAKTIRTEADAKQAATNFARYVS
jgi:hypothetical protein